MGDTLRLAMNLGLFDVKTSHFQLEIGPTILAASPSVSGHAPRVAAFPILVLYRDWFSVDFNRL